MIEYSYIVKLKLGLLYCIYLFLSINPKISYAQYDFEFDSVQVQNYQAYLSLDFDFSKSYLENNTKNGISIYLSNYTDILNLLISEDFEVLEKLSPNEGIRLDFLEKMNPNSPYYLFTQAEIKLQWAIIKLKYGNKLAAVWGLRKAYRDLLENQKKFPNFIPNKKSLGLLQVVFAAVPQKYQWAMKIIGLEGNLEKGLQNIKQVIDNQGIYSWEARIFELLLDVYILEKNELTFNKSMLLRQENTRQNLFLDFVSILIFIKTKHQNEALQILKQIHENSKVKIPYLDYLRAELELYNGNYRTSQKYYKSFLKNYKGKNFIKDTYYKLFLADWLEKGKMNFLDKEKHFQLIRSHGSELTQVDKYAMKFVETTQSLQIDLMQARLLFDGGHFERSLFILNKIKKENLKSLAQRTELVYRKARVFHELKEEQLAIKFYKETIHLGAKLPQYFAAYSALQLGYLFEEEEKKVAKLYFQKAISFPKQEYKDSIDNKAKAALKNIKRSK